MSVYIDSPRGKEKLVAEFSKFTQVTDHITQDTLLIIPTVDETLPLFAQNLNFFESLGIKVMVSSPATIRICRDKAEFYRSCRRMGFKTPVTMQDKLIAKPRFGKGSRGIIRIDESYIVQPIIDLPEVSIDYFADLDGKFISAIPRYRLDIQNGESQAHELVEGFDDTEVKRLGEALQLVGHNVIQGFLSPDKTLCFTEVNPRFGGGSWMTFDIFSSPQFLTEYYACTLTKKSSITRLDSSTTTTSKTNNTKTQ